MCLFCKIAQKEIPSTMVYENDDVYAFLDIAPVNLGHVLVIPKRHFENCADTTDEAMSAVMRVVKRVGAAANKATGAQGYNVAINCGAVAGQVIMHTHVHVIPRFADDGLQLWGKREIPKEEMDRVAAALRQEL